MNTPSKLLAAALISAAVPLFIAPAAALPLAPLSVMQNQTALSAETVQYRRGGGWRGGRGVGIGLGIAAGAIIGGAIANSQPYGYGYRNYGYGYAPAYSQGYYVDDVDEGYAVAPGGGGSAVAYCAQRYRSYDPRSGTFLGYDGLRHPCP